jgi:predicted esterase
MGVKRHIHPKKKERTMSKKQAKRLAQDELDLDAKEAQAKAANVKLAETNGASGAKETAAVVWLHGLGDCGASWTSLISAMKASHIKWVFPDAPKQPVSCNGGSYMPSWFDLKKIPVESGGWDDKAGLTAAVARIHAIVAKLEKRNGIAPERVMIGGFSQGGCASLLAVLTSDKKLGGAICFSGWLARENEYPGLIHEANNQTPIFWGHGEDDDTVMFSAACKGRDKLLASLGDDKGVGSGGSGLLTFQTYPGMEHSSSPTEERDLRQWLARHLPADPNAPIEEEDSADCSSSTDKSAAGGAEKPSAVGKDKGEKQGGAKTQKKQKQNKRGQQTFSIRVSKKSRK